MHRLAFVPLLCSAGCLLYTGDLNHAPKIDDVKVQQTANYKGVPIHFEVVGTDPDHDPLYRDDPVIASLDGQPLADCDHSYNGYGNGSFDITFFRTGMFSVTTKMHDSQGATSSGFMITIKVDNAPPEFDTDSKITAVQSLDACSAYTAGQGIPIQLNKAVNDADATAAGCKGPETITYHWTTTTPPAGSAVFSAYANGACEPMSSMSPMDFTTTSAGDEVCLWPQYGTIGVSSTYTVKVTASDGGNDTASLTVDVPVQADGPPCIEGADPPAGSYVVDPNNPAPFDSLTISSVADDLDGSLGPGTKLQIFWSVWRESDPTWRTIPISGNHYSPDFSIFGVGEKVRFRAEAVDRTLTRASCNSDDDFCPVASCASTNCTQWTTWDLELR